MCVFFDLFKCKFNSLYCIVILFVFIVLCLFYLILLSELMGISRNFNKCKKFLFRCVASMFLIFFVVVMFRCVFMFFVIVLFNVSFGV